MARGYGTLSDEMRAHDREGGYAAMTTAMACSEVLGRLAAAGGADGWGELDRELARVCWRGVERGIATLPGKRRDGVRTGTLWLMFLEAVAGRRGEMVDFVLSLGFDPKLVDGDAAGVGSGRMSAGYGIGGRDRSWVSVFMAAGWPEKAAELLMGGTIFPVGADGSPVFPRDWAKSERVVAAGGPAWRMWESDQAWWRDMAGSHPIVRACDGAEPGKAWRLLAEPFSLSLEKLPDGGHAALLYECVLTGAEAVSLFFKAGGRAGPFFKDSGVEDGKGSIMSGEDALAEVFADYATLDTPAARRAMEKTMAALVDGVAAEGLAVSFSKIPAAIGLRALSEVEWRIGNQMPLAALAGGVGRWSGVLGGAGRGVFARMAGSAGDAEEFASKVTETLACMDGRTLAKDPEGVAAIVRASTMGLKGAAGAVPREKKQRGRGLV